MHMCEKVVTSLSISTQRTRINEWNEVERKGKEMQEEKEEEEEDEKNDHRCINK